MNEVVESRKNYLFSKDTQKYWIHLIFLQFLCINFFLKLLYQNKNYYNFVCNKIFLYFKLQAGIFKQDFCYVSIKLTWHRMLHKNNIQINAHIFYD